jgi:DNA-directed RNA polymerase subunit RPC12/RpoP
MRKPSINTVRDVMAELHQRCPACRHRILPGQKTELVNGKRHHKACAVYNPGRR